MEELPTLVFFSELGLILIVYLLAPALAPKKEHPVTLSACVPFDKPGPEEHPDFAAYEAQEAYEAWLAEQETSGPLQAPANDSQVA